MMIRPSEEILEIRKVYEPYRMFVEECEHAVLRPDAPNEAVEAFIKFFEYMTGEKPDVVKWTK